MNQPVAAYCAGGGSDDDEDGSGEEGGTSREDIKKDLLLGHLLALAAQEGGTMPPHALPILAASLAATGLLPRWVQVCETAFTPLQRCPAQVSPGMLPALGMLTGPHACISAGTSAGVRTLFWPMSASHSCWGALSHLRRKRNENVPTLFGRG